jgi:hypothetical protein
MGNLPDSRKSFYFDKNNFLSIPIKVFPSNTGQYMNYRI